MIIITKKMSSVSVRKFVVLLIFEAMFEEVFLSFYFLLKKVFFIQLILVLHSKWEELPDFDVFFLQLSRMSFFTLIIFLPELGVQCFFEGFILLSELFLVVTLLLSLSLVLVVVKGTFSGFSFYEGIFLFM
jgi:hypothetical protein